MPDARTASRPEDWDRLIDRILQELRGPAGNHLPGAVQKFLCELLSAILLRSYRAYSLEKLFGQGNSGPRGAVKDAIEEDNQEMSFDAVTEFAARNGFRPIETVRGNRRKSGQPGVLTGEQFFDCIWGDQPHASMSRHHWDEAGFRQQYHRICEELNTLPGPARGMRQELEQTLAYRFFQSQTVFSYPDPNAGTFASTSKPANQGEQRPRKVWYHQTPLFSKEVSTEAVERVVRCNENPATLDNTPEYWKPRRLPEEVQSITSWEGVKSYCRKHELRFAA